MNIHLLGNGPSITLFSHDICTPSDILVGCNFSEDWLNPHFVSIIDLSTMRKIVDTDIVCRFPAVIADRCMDYAKDNAIKIESYQLTILDTIPLKKIKSIGRHIPMNSGQHGLLYAMEKNPEIRNIHIWGTDSFWTDDISSSSDQHIRKSDSRVNPRIARIWKGYWDHIFTSNPDHRFYIHCHTEQDSSHANVEYVIH